MPVRRAKPPGEFIAQHMRDVGGIDYPQNVHREYKSYLRSQGLKNLPCRATMSHYFWLANKMGLIVFDHSESPVYWDGLLNFPRTTRRAVRQSRPLAPSPRYYYKIIDPDDPRWLRLETSHRQEIRIPVPPAFPRSPVEELTPEEEEAVVEEVEVPVKPKTRKERVKKAKKEIIEKVKKPSSADVATAAAQPFEDGFKKISAELDLLGVNPTIAAVEKIENDVADLGGKLLDTLEGKKGLLRDRLLLENSKLTRVVEDLPLVRNSLTSMLNERLPARRVSYRQSLDNAIRVVKEDLARPPEEAG